jgi:hypothetical protein
MIIQELTDFYKKSNIFLNLFLWIFFISLISNLLILLIVNHPESFYELSFNLMIFSLVFLLLSLFIVIIRDHNIKKINLKIDQNTILEINSKVDMNEIKRYNDIRHSGNYIINGNNKIEISNKEVYRILQSDSIYQTKMVKNKTKFIEKEPVNYFDDILYFFSYFHKI